MNVKTIKTTATIVYLAHVCASLLIIFLHYCLCDCICLLSVLCQNGHLRDPLLVSSPPPFTLRAYVTWNTVVSPIFVSNVFIL